MKKWNADLNGFSGLKTDLFPTSWNGLNSMLNVASKLVIDFDEKMERGFERV